MAKKDTNKTTTSAGTMPGTNVASQGYTPRPAVVAPSPAVVAPRTPENTPAGAFNNTQRSGGITGAQVAANNAKLRQDVANAKAGTGPSVGLVGAPAGSTYQDVAGKNQTPAQFQLEQASKGLVPKTTQMAEGVDINAYTSQFIENASANFMKTTEALNTTLSSSLGELQKQLSLAGEANKVAFDAMVTNLGSAGKGFQEQLQAIQSASGQAVDLTNPSLQKEIQDAQAQGKGDFKPIMEKYLGAKLPSQGIAQRMPESTQQLDGLISQAKKLGIDQSVISSAEKARNMDAAIFPEVIRSLQDSIANQEADLSSSGIKPDQLPQPLPPTPEQALNQQLDNIIGSSPESLSTMLGNMDFENMTPGQIMSSMFKMNVQSIAGSDDKVNKYLDMMEKNFTQSYEDGIAMGKQGTKEIDAVISGKNISPSTMEGLNAKVFKDASDFSIESLEMQRDYMTDKFDIEMDRERTKRARLDGYLKAKLYSAGAADSTAGLTMMALQTDAADLRLQQMSTDQNFQIAQINLETRKVKTDYANSIASITIQADQNRQAAKGKLDEQLMSITGQRITNEQEKNKLMLSAFNNYATESVRIQESERNFKLQTEQFALQKNQAKIQEQVQMAGLYGTIFSTGADGQLMDTGIKTFEAQKYDQDYAMRAAQFQHTVSTGNWGKVMDVFGQYDDVASVPDGVKSLAYNMLGNVPGLDQAQNMGQMKSAANLYYQDMVNIAGSYNEIQSKEINDTLLSVSGQGIKNYGLNIDPLAIADARDTLSNFSYQMTQGYFKAGSSKGTDPRGGHTGVDLVFTQDGDNPVNAPVPALRGGMVVDVFKDSGNAGKTPYGNRMLVQDGQGVIWQYSHFSNMNLQKGDIVGAGDILGQQGNTGRIISSPAGGGHHTDIRIVGHSKPTWTQQDPVNGSISNPAVDFFSPAGVTQNDLKSGKLSALTETANRIGQLRSTEGERAGFYSEIIEPKLKSGNVIGAVDDMRFVISEKGRAEGDITLGGLNQITSQWIHVAKKIENYKNTVYQKEIAKEKSPTTARKEADKSLGFWAGQEAKWGDKVNRGDPELRELRTTLDSALKSYVKQISGAAATDNEMAFIQSFVPKAGTDANVNIKRAQALVEEAINKKSTLLGKYAGQSAEVNMALGADNIKVGKDGNHYAYVYRASPNSKGRHYDIYPLNF